MSRNTEAASGPKSLESFMRSGSKQSDLLGENGSRGEQDHKKGFTLEKWMWGASTVT